MASKNLFSSSTSGVESMNVTGEATINASPVVPEVEYANAEAAFAEYEERMRPVVDRAQKLAPGAPHILSPETAWGIWTTNIIMSLLMWSGIAKLLFMFLGPPANTVPVEDFGFKQLPALEEQKN